MTDDAQWFIAASHPFSDPAALRGLPERMRERVDWRLFLDRAKRHKTMLLACSNLNSGLPDATPPDKLDLLRQASLPKVARNTFLAGELIRLVDLLAAGSVRAIPIKGPTLAALAYDNIAMRQFDDLDFLLPPRDVLRGMKILESEGFSPTIPLSAQERRAHIRAGWGGSLRSPSGDYFVELDTDVVPGYFGLPADFERLWENREAVRIDEREILTLNRATLLPLLCVHGTKHLWEKLGWVCDVAGLAHYLNDQEWEDVVRQTRAMGTLRMLCIGLRIVEQLWGMPLPKCFADVATADPTVDRLCRECLVRIVRWPPVTPGWRETRRFHLQSRERAHDRRLQMWRQILTPGWADWQACRLPAILFPLYYLLRPLRLAWSFLAGTGRLRRSSVRSSSPGPEDTGAPE